MLTDQPTRLTQLERRSAFVVALNLPPCEAQRLKSLGVFEGQRISWRKSGNPMIFSAAGSRIAVARELAERILVQVDQDVAT